MLFESGLSKTDCGEADLTPNYYKTVVLARLYLLTKPPLCCGLIMNPI